MVGRRLVLAALLLAPTATSAAVRGQHAYTIDRSLVTELKAPDGHSYRLFVAWPDGTPPVRGWPVLYVLDGADTFAIAADTARRLARAGARSGIQDGIVVGVDSGPLARRVLDYTPPAAGYRIPAGMPAYGLATGGSEAFLDLLSASILPRIAHRWHVDPTRQTLAGHSFGGLLALHAAFSRPGPFTAYAAISPSLWYGDGLLEAEQTKAAPTDLRLLIAVGDEERVAGNLTGPEARALTDTLVRRGADASFQALSGQGHGTSMLAAMGEVIALAFGTAR